ncbi:MAG TPA: hypothetical protein VGE01_00605 [Fimbriimonas sp.]
MTRREFLKSIGRWSFGSALVGTAAAMANREKCSNRGICSGCGRSSSCVLPQAMTYREATRLG